MDRAARKIAISHSRKPIPTDRFDWMASFEDDEPDDNGYMAVGFGTTEEDAIDDLMHRSGALPPFPIVKSGAYS